MDPFETVKETSESNLTVEQTKLQRMARYLTYYHLAMVPIIIFFGNFLVELVDRIGNFLFNMKEIEISKNDFWIVPIIGLFLTLALVSWRVWKNVERIDWMQPIMAVHGIMAASFLVYFFVVGYPLSYLMATILELALFLASSYYWWAARSSTEGGVAVHDS